jgi:hypothetical protein
MYFVEHSDDLKLSVQSTVQRTAYFIEECFYLTFFIFYAIIVPNTTLLIAEVESSSKSHQPII